MINTIIDTYHGNSINMQAVKDGGIIAVIHKATQGQHFRDKAYHARRQQARDLGLLWGAYHFSTGDPIDNQVENFLSYAKPEDDELISLDWEPSDGPDMTLDAARAFVQMIKNETGRWPLIYGGRLLRESLLHKTDPILANCPLWYARYGSSPVGIPTQIWPTYTLWQYTDSDKGPEPHKTPGVEKADRNIFNGTEQQLRDQWPFTRRDNDAIMGPGFHAILHS